MNLTPKPHAKGGVHSPTNGTEAQTVIDSEGVNSPFRVEFSFTAYTGSINLEAELTENGLKYTGSETIKVPIVVTFNSKSTVANVFCEWILMKNASEIATSKVTQELTAADTVGEVSISAFVEIAQNDVITLSVTTDTATTMKSSYCSMVISDTW